MGKEGAGRKAWETRRTNDARAVALLYRSAFSPAKEVARRRVIAALQAAGGRTCLDLWGGGTSAESLVAAGFSVISVEDGSLELSDADGKVSSIRKQRAAALAASENGYELRYGGNALVHAAADADVAWLDFCGPWTPSVREAVTACQHMRAVVVTLTTDHDIHTKSTNQRERLAAYILWLKMAYRPTLQRQQGLGRGIQSTRCRLLCAYSQRRGQPVWVFLLSSGPVAIRHLSSPERYALSPAYASRTNAQARDYQRNRRAIDPEYKRRYKERVAAWKSRKLAKDPDYVNRLQREFRARKRAGDPTYRPRGKRSPRLDATAHTAP